MTAIDDVLLACLLANLAGLGAAAFVLLRPSARAGGPRLLCFALGVLVGTVLLDLLPQLWEATGSVIMVTALFAVALSASWWLDRVWPCVAHRRVPHHAGLGHAACGARSDTTRRSVLLWAGDFVHSVVDGAVIGGALALGVVPGSVVTMAVAIHEVPRRMAVVTLLVRAGHPPLSALLITVGTGTGTMVGGALVWWFAPVMSMVMPVALAVAASAMFYVALSHSANLFGAAWRQRLATERAVPFVSGLLMIQLSHQAHDLLG